MIGLNTIIIKQGDHICAHRIGMFFQHDIVNGAKKRRVTQYQLIASSVKKWGKPDADNLTIADIETIASAQTDDENYNQKYGKLRYHKLAGDGVYLLDMDAKTFTWYDRQVKSWLEVTTNYC